MDQLTSENSVPRERIVFLFHLKREMLSISLWLLFPFCLFCNMMLPAGADSGASTSGDVNNFVFAVDSFSYSLNY